MKATPWRVAGLGLGLVAAAGSVGCHDAVPLASTGRDHPVTVDGDRADWEGLTQ